MINTKLLKKVIKTTKQTKLYKRLLQREFREISNFPKFTEVCMDIATCFYVMTKMIEDPKYEYTLRVHIWNNIFSKLCKNITNFPVYACSSELTELLKNTDPLQEYVKVKDVFNSCLVLLPENYNIFIDNKIKAKVKYLLLSFYPQGNKQYLKDIPEYIKEYKDNDININYLNYFALTTFNGKSCWTDLPTLYYSFFDVDWIVNDNRSIESVAEGVIQFETDTGDIRRFGYEMKEEGHTVLSQIDDFVTNLFLFFQTRQDSEIEYMESNVFSNTRIGKGKQLKLHRYRKLDLQNKVKKYRKLNTTHNNHTSPITHWRRGHWRNQPCGEKLQDSKIIWIQPTLINPNN